MTEGWFFVLLPRFWSREPTEVQNKLACICCQQQDHLLGMVLRQTKLDNESNSNLNTGASRANYSNYFYSGLQ